MAQQVLFAQQLGAHGFSLGMFVMMHVAAGSRTVAVNSAITIATETVILRIMPGTDSTIVAINRIRH